MSCKWPKDIVCRKYRVGSDRPVETLLSQEEIRNTIASGKKAREERKRRVQEKFGKKTQKDFSNSYKPRFGFRKETAIEKSKNVNLSPKEMSILVRHQLANCHR